MVPKQITCPEVRPESGNTHTISEHFIVDIDSLSSLLCIMMKKHTKKLKKSNKSIVEPSETNGAIAHQVTVSSLILPPSINFSNKNYNNKNCSKFLERVSFGHNIYSIDHFLSPFECQKWIEYAEHIGFENVFQREDKEYAYRNNGRIQFNNQDIASSIYNRVLPFLPEVARMASCGCSDNIRLYKYATDQRFGKHIDESNFDRNLNGYSKYTLLVYLNGPMLNTNPSCVADTDINAATTVDLDASVPLVGGETIFHTSKNIIKIQPHCGRLCFHGHGSACLLHEGAVVEAGVKYLLRTDIVYKLI